MKTRILVWLLLLCAHSTWAQLLVQETFETDGEGNRYKSGFFSVSTTQYFFRAALPGTPGGTAPNFGGTALSGTQGSYFWACEGVRGSGSTVLRNARYVCLKGIDVSGYTNVRIKVAFADPRSNQGVRENTDFMRVQYRYGDTIGTFKNAIVFTKDPTVAATTGRWARLDSAALLSPTFSNHRSAAIDAGTGLLYVRVLADYNFSSQEIAFDNIRVTGTASTVQQPTLTSNVGNSTLTFAEGTTTAQTVFSDLTVGNPAKPTTPTLTGATVTMSGYAGTQDEVTYTIPSGSGITASSSNNAGTLTLTFSSTTPANSGVGVYKSLLESVKYKNTEVNNATAGDRTFSFVVRDGTVESIPLSRVINVTTALNAATAPPRTETFDSDGEGTRYASNTRNLPNQGFLRLEGVSGGSHSPGATYASTATFTNLQGTGYWYSNGSGAILAGGVGRVMLAPVNTTGFVDLRFKIKAGTNNTTNFGTTDFLRFSYSLDGSTNWIVFTNYTGVSNKLRLDGVSTNPALGAALTDLDIALPAGATGPNVYFRVETASSGGEEIVFDNIQITGTGLPTVTTTTPSAVAPTSATLGGSISNDGGGAITGRGVVYSSSDNTPTIGEAGVTQDTNPSTTSPFSESIAGLTAATTYYVRAYAINAAGTSYGAVETFTTPTTVTSIVRADANPTKATSVNFTVTFASPVTGVTSSNFSLTSGTGFSTLPSISGVSGTGTTYTVTVNTGVGDGTIRLNLANASGISPGVSNTLPFTGETYDIDKTRPAVTISSSAGASGSTTTTSPIPFTLTFSENVSGFAAGDVTVINGSITGGIFTGTSPGTIYTFTVTPATPGTATTVSVPANVVQDAASNFNTAAPSSYSITYNQPNTTVASVTRLTPSPTATAQVRYRVVFASSVTGITVNNFSLTTSGLTGTGISSVVGSGTTYTVTANTGTGTGTLTLNVQNSTGITPTVTNVPYTSGEQYSIIKSFAAAPQLSLRGAGSATNNNDVTAFVDLVQVVQSGTSTAVTNGLQNGSFETNNVPAGGFLYQQNGVAAAPWAFTTQAGVSRNGAGGFGSTAPAGGGDAVALLQSFNGTNGSISQNLAVPTGSYQVNLTAVQRTNQTSDQVVNMFLVEGSNTVFIGDFLPTTVYQPFTSASFSVAAPALTATVSSTAAATGGTTNTTPIPFAVDFSQSVGTNFVDTDVTVTNGTITSGSFSGSGAGPYTFTVAPTTFGTATTVSLAAGVAQDANNTPNSASNSYSVTYNQPITPTPTVTIPSNGATTNSTPTSLGSAVVGSTVRVYIDGVQVGAAVTPNSGGTWIRTFSGLPALTSGTHTVYATAQLPGQAVSAPSATNTFTVQVPATYSSSAAAQASTARVVAGSTNQAILQVAIVIGGGPDAPISATSFTFTTTGSTSPADIAAARVYYTGTSNTFAATNQFGSATANPNGTFTITGGRQLVTGTNYFWLAYDVAPGATIGNVLDATAPSFTLFDGSFPSTRNPSTPAPAGNRQIVRISRVAGTALRFTGNTTAGYADFSASTTPAPTLNTGTSGAYSQVAWIKPAIGTGSTNYYVLGNGTGNSAAPYIYVTGNGRLGAGFGTGTATFNLQTGPNLVSSNEWHHVAATYTGSSLTLYLDGVAVNSGSASGTPAATRVNYIGNVAASGSNNFPGDLDEVSQWTRALSATELRQFRHLTLSGSETSLVSYVQFNDAGTTATDGISGAVGTLTGATRVTSTAPVGAGVSNLQSVTGTGNYSFSGTNVAINFTAVAGAPYDVVVSRLEGTPLGTPVSDPNLRSTHTRAYWIVDKYNDNTFTAAVTYTLDQGLISAGDATTPSNLKLYKRGSNADGAFDAPISATAANAAASTVTFPVTSFSQTFIGTYGSSPLPVELVRFTAERKGNDALLQWATAQERNNAYFEVESSVDGRTFRAIGRVTGHGTSTQAQEYTLTDANLARYARSVVYYRLRQVDVDGTSTLSAVQTVRVPGVTSSLTALVFPNPAVDQLTVRLSGPYGKAQGWLFDAQGRMVQELSRPLAAAGGSDIHLSVANLPTGVYTLRLVLDGQVLHQQIVVQR